jgi:hypothetical protein
LPDLLEEGCEQAVALGWGLLAIQKLAKSASTFSASVSCGSAGALQLVLDGLAAHDVLRFREVAEDEQLLQAAELVELGLPVGSAALLPCLLGGPVEHNCPQVCVGP